MSSKANLADAMRDVAGSTRKRQPEPTKRKTKEPSQPSRRDTKAITVHFPQNVRDQLKILAVEQGTTIQNMAAEAFNDLFAKYEKPEIAPHTEQ